MNKCEKYMRICFDIFEDYLKFYFLLIQNFKTYNENFNLISSDVVTSSWEFGQICAIDLFSNGKFPIVTKTKYIYIYIYM